MALVKRKTAENPSQTKKQKVTRVIKKASPEQSISTGHKEQAETEKSNSKTFDCKITCWNVAGMKGFMKNGPKFVIDTQPDILLLQETKLRSGVNETGHNLAHYTSHFCSTKDESGKKGYAGLALFTKRKPLSIQCGLGIAQHDAEGRVITAEFDDFYFVGTYVPNSGRGLVRLENRRKWNAHFLNFLLQLDAKKPVVVGGDMNVAHQEIDLANPKTNRRNAGFTDEERADFTKLLDSGFVDVYRKMNPSRTGAYTFWTHMGKCRSRNVGWRLDYFLVSERLLAKVRLVEIQSEILGSDHCPITLCL